MAQPGDHLRDLDAGKLTALAGLRPLGHLDLELPAIVEIFGVDAEPRRGHLLDRRRGVVAVGPERIAGRVLAALSRIRLGADAVHGDGQGLVGFGAQRAKRNARRHQPLADLGDRFDLLQGDGLTILFEIE